MRKFATMSVVLLCATCMVIASGCSSQNTSQNGSEAPSSTASTSSAATESQEPSPLALTTVDAVKEASMKDAEDTVATLTAGYEQLVADISTYEVYLESTDRVSAFYDECISSTEALCLSLEKYALNYAQLVIDSGKTSGAQYDDLQGIYDYIYEDAAKVIYDDIYDGVLDEMYDSFYNGLLDDAYNSASYGTWSEAKSNEYKIWSDARSDVYGAWSDCRSDIYSFWSDIRGDVFADRADRAQKDIDDFQDDIDRLATKNS